MIRSHSVTAIVSLLFFIPLVFLHSCANIIPPTGGPRDSLAPHLIKAIPDDSSKHFKTNRITLQFDEYVAVDNPQDNVIVWPNPKNPPVIEAKLRTVSIKLRDSLEKNTTYTINFGKSLKDVNEGNADSSFSYVFSTGETLDHNVLKGSVRLAETGRLDTTLLVVLQTNLNDTAIEKTPPRYYAKLNGKGNFRFYNLPTDTFNVFVVPNDYTKRYDDSTKMFAFLKSPIFLKDSTSKPLSLFAYEEFKETAKRPGGGNRSSGGGAAGGNRTAGSSSEKASSRKKKTADTTLKLTYDLQNGKQDFQKNLPLNFSDTLESFDSSKIHLTDTNYVSLPGIHLKTDTVANKLLLSYKWKENTPYKLVIEKDAVTDSAGHTLHDNDTLSFYTLRESDYGSIRVRFQNLDTSKHPVLELIQNDKIVQMVPLTHFEWYQKFFLPGDYELRVLFDVNRNGKWDAGSYAQKKQPEIVQTVTTRGGGNKISIRANWDNEWPISIPPLQ